MPGSRCSSRTGRRPGTCSPAPFFALVLVGAMPTAARLSRPWQNLLAVLTDSTCREEFLDGVTAELAEVFEVRAAYRRMRAGVGVPVRSPVR